VVLSYGTGGEYEALLASLLEEGMPAEGILVVHNPASPEEPDPVTPPGCEVLRASHNLGYAAGMNLGIERELASGCKWLLLLTHDARLRPGSLDAILAAAERHPEYGVFGPAQIFTGTEAPFSYGGLTRPNGTMTHRVEYPVMAEDGIAACDWIDGGTMLIRVDVLAQVGGFDERLWSYCEEAELCLRISRAGYRIGVVPDAIADQAPGGPKRLGPWAYLLTRNGGAYAYRAAGLRGLAFFSARAALLTLYELIRTLARGLRLRGGPAIEPWATVVGTTRGMLDLYRRRWGPPPPLPGAGDVSNVAPPASEGDLAG
jgi:GT2 family glycosyltransferase